MGAQAFRQELSEARFYAIIAFEVVAHIWYFHNRLIVADNLTEVYYLLATSPILCPIFVPC
jgi:hypothetical protein